jgi:hypothetical protein
MMRTYNVRASTQSETFSSSAGWSHSRERCLEGLFGGVALSIREKRSCFADQRSGVANLRNPESQLNCDTNAATRCPSIIVYVTGTPIVERLGSLCHLPMNGSGSRCIHWRSNTLQT